MSISNLEKYVKNDYSYRLVEGVFCSMVDFSINLIKRNPHGKFIGLSFPFSINYDHFNDSDG